MTLRVSSLWDRWRGDGPLTDSEWNAWLALDYPDALTSDNKNQRSQQICPAVMAELVWLFFRDELTATQVREYFSLSDHEHAQVGDIVATIQTGLDLTEKKSLWQDYRSWSCPIEQRGADSKAFVYGKLGVRDDVANG